MTTLKAEKRSMDVKAKRLRREGFVTGNVFGHAIEGSIPVKMNVADAERLLKTEHKGGQINLDIEGQVYDVLIKEIDYNAMTRKIDEIDFQALVSDEKVTSTAEIVILNREAVVGGVLQEDLSEVAYRAFPSALVEKTTLDAAGLKVGDIVHVKDLDIAKNKDIDLKTDPEAVVLSVIACAMPPLPKGETLAVRQSFRFCQGLSLWESWARSGLRGRGSGRKERKFRRK